MAEASPAHGINPLNILFLELDNSLKEDDVDLMKNLLRGEQVPTKAVGKLRSAFDVFHHLKEHGDIDGSNLDLLVQLFEQMGKEPLKERVQKFQKEHSPTNGKAIQSELPRKDGDTMQKTSDVQLDLQKKEESVTEQSGNAPLEMMGGRDTGVDKDKHTQPMSNKSLLAKHDQPIEVQVTKRKTKTTKTKQSNLKPCVMNNPSGGWSKFILDGQGPSPGQKFNNPCGLTFHDDKLLVCDKGNNIVQILNQDYTCEKVLGSFSGQFAKPFTPWSVAVSNDNHYFILDDSNLQIVVCDQNNKVIGIITLPVDINPWCIALLKGFVLVTDVKGRRLLKYTKTGQYVGELGGPGFGPTEFTNPYNVAVNSRDVIMVSDKDTHCIKCFDSDFNYLYHYGEYGNGDSQLCHPDSIAVDGADNVYVCDGNDRISMWSRDGTWICNLFQDELSLPEYIAVSRGRICVRGRDDKHITVFSK